MIRYTIFKCIMWAAKKVCIMEDTYDCLIEAELAEHWGLYTFPNWLNKQKDSE